MTQRVYLDHNATTPLRGEARDAMIAAMDLVGNPSSVHAEGRAAKGLVETARAQVAKLVRCLPNQVIFTSGATEAAALAVAQKHRFGGVFAALPTEHDCLLEMSDQVQPGSLWREDLAGQKPSVDALSRFKGLLGLSAANSETGILGAAMTGDFAWLCDITQMAGKIPVAFKGRRPAFAIMSAHKLGGPKGVGALINFTAEDPAPLWHGGGQEMNRRAGTENVIGIAGFGAAAAAAGRDVVAGRWSEVAQFRNILESALEAASRTTIFVGKDVARLPNTSCALTPGWKGETQVMQMDLAGFAISAGSACSSGKVRPSRVLRAMGYGDDAAASAIRVSLGLETTEDDVLRFADAWAARLRKHEMRAA